MRKILMLIIILLLLALGYVTVMDGVKISDFQVLSVKQIEEESQNLKTKIEELNNLIDVEYPKKRTDLSQAGKNLEDAKEEYLQYTNLSTDEEILAAMQQKSYAIEFLWTKIGTHAKKEGINLKFEIASSGNGANNANDIKFTVEGSYIAVTNFIYAIENDTELNFRIENFKLLPNQGEILQGTFTVRNIAVEGNTSTQSVTATGTTNNNNNNTNTNTTNTNTTNTNTTNTTRVNRVEI